MVSNGDFEAQNIGTLNYKPGGANSVTGWTSTQSELAKGPFFNTAWPNGSQVLEMDTNNENTKYNQTISLTVGL